MKKLFISFLAVGALFTSCADFDEPTAQIFGEGPSIEISAVEATDTELTFTVTPGQGTNYYTYAITKGDAAKEINGEALLKDQISSIESGVMKASITPTKKVVFDGCTPNTSYVIYAVAGDTNGSAGKVASKVVKTSDTSTPKFSIADAVKGEDSYTLPFSEAITRGEGKVSAKYFVEWADDPFVEVAEEDLTVAVEGNKVTFKTANVPGNCYVLISFEEGAFVDQVGNKCQAVESGFNAAMTGFTGCYFQTPAVPFKVDINNVTSPEPGKISDWKTPVVLSFEHNIYSLDETKAQIDVTYESEDRSVTYHVTSWSIGPSSFEFNLPAEPQQDDVISVSLGEGIMTDVYGNPNMEVAFDNIYKYDANQWVAAGKCYFTDYTWWEDPVSASVDIENIAGTNMYRLVNPYYTIDQANGGVEGLTKANIEFTLEGDGTITMSDGVYDLGLGDYQMYYNTAKYADYCFILNEGKKYQFSFLLLFQGSKLYTGGAFEFEWTEGYPVK